MINTIEVCSTHNISYIGDKCPICNDNIEVCSTHNISYIGDKCPICNDNIMVKLKSKIKALENKLENIQNLLDKKEKE